MEKTSYIHDFDLEIREFILKYKDYYDRMFKLQRANEAEIIMRTNSFCNIERIKNRWVTAKQVKEALTRKPDDPEVLNTLLCFNNSLVFFPPNPEGLDYPLKIRRYFQNLELIGSDSVDSYAFKTGLDPDSKDEMPFVIKAPRPDNPVEGIILHEYFVGAFGTNTLRSRIPNFAYILGYFRCSAPILDENPNSQSSSLKNIVYCQNAKGTQVDYVLYENVTNSISLDKFLSWSDLGTYINILTQLVLALDLAYEEFEYTHYDLHAQNVLIKKLEEEIIVSYPIGNFKTKYLAVIIDQGRAHIKYMGKHYGYMITESWIYPDRGYPIYDIHRILVSSLYYTELVNPKLHSLIKDLLKYFHPSLRGIQYLPYVDEYIQIRPRDFYFEKIAKLKGKYINFLSPLDLITELKSHKRFGCSHRLNTCLNQNKAIEEYSTEIKDLLGNDPYLFYEAYLKVKNQEEEVKTKRAELDFYWRNSRDLYFEKLTTDYNNLKNKISRAELENPLISTDLLNKYAEIVTRLNEIVKIMEGLVSGFNLLEKESLLAKSKIETRLLTDKVFTKLDLKNKSKFFVKPDFKH